ncbi:MAG: PAM68 family protein [Leptolyngbyaceae cyanobacterium]
MTSKPGSGEEKKGKSDRLPFEPSSNRKKGNKAGGSATSSSATGSKPTGSRSTRSKSTSPKASDRKTTASSASASTAKNASSGQKSDKSSSSTQSRRPKYSSQETAIPEDVSRRMIKRMAVLSGVPTVLGLASFVISYFIVINDVIEVPPIAVLLVSLGFFGLGVLGISYGALSTSWDEGNEGGSLLGWDEFTTNLGRMKQAWQESRNQSRS